jgi:REP element-mobilizing transposase RayT
LAKEVEMANTFTQLYIQIIFSTKGREKILPKNHKDVIQKYITGIIQKRNHKLIVINNMPDHIHIFIGLNPSQAISDLVRDIKQNSTKFIKKNRMLIGNFAWQEGYGAFSYSHSQIDEVVKYIQNQEEHHRKKTFKEEYLEFLEKFGIEYDIRYVFD